MLEKDGLSIDLAEKQHNMKILLEDNLRLKQKIKIAKSSALNLINKIKVSVNWMINNKYGFESNVLIDKEV